MNYNEIKLNNGYKIPQIGFGVYMIPEYEECKKAVLEAIKAGYRHIDTAQLYGNERAVGDAIRESGIPREEIFVTSKIWITDYGYKKTKAAVENSLQQTGFDYIDLMLLHKQYNDYIGAWKALEKCVDEGSVRSIGISSFNKKRTIKLLEKARIKPVVNQVECHPYLQQEDTRRFLDENGIKMEVWYPVGHGDKKLLQEPVFSELAKKYNKSVVQIILRWHIQHGNIVFPKSTNPKHIQENIDIFDFELSKEDMMMISGINKNKSYTNIPQWLEKIVFQFYNKLPFGVKE